MNALKTHDGAAPEQYSRDPTPGQQAHQSSEAGGRPRPLENGEGPPALRWTIERVEDDRREQVVDRVVLEEPLEIAINGRRVALLMRLPGAEKELAAGFAISEGYVRAMRDILLIHHCGLGLPSPAEEPDAALGSRNRVELRVVEGDDCAPTEPDAVRLIRSGCGAAPASLLGEGVPALSSALRVRAGTLLDLSRAMRAGQEVHRAIGGTHAAALFTDSGTLVALAEDIGRHNAVDKALGHCLLRGIPLADKVLVTSGRASYDMALKAIRAGVPVIASASAPTSLAVQLAEDRGLTLIGYLRGGRMNVYTHAYRITDR
ncbi:MAG: formate dehydrogenase accessory sulfurtransferase FdhD [Anaerolineae bacterium]|nr:formate dehydrogenase accessory sulfurtransferase FdhD [Anaerolineae bacterium]